MIEEPLVFRTLSLDLKGTRKFGHRQQLPSRHGAMEAPSMIPFQGQRDDNARSIPR
jgi:hypothetical protein